MGFVFFDHPGTIPLKPALLVIKCELMEPDEGHPGTGGVYLKILVSDFGRGRYRDVSELSENLGELITSVRDCGLDLNNLVLPVRHLLFTICKI